MRGIENKLKENNLKGISPVMKIKMDTDETMHCNNEKDGGRGLSLRETSSPIKYFVWGLSLRQTSSPIKYFVRYIYILWLEESLLRDRKVQSFGCIITFRTTTRFDNLK